VCHGGTPLSANVRDGNSYRKKEGKRNRGSAALQQKEDVTLMADAKGSNCGGEEAGENVRDVRVLDRENLGSKGGGRKGYSQGLRIGSNVESVNKRP